jgi:hypothetical protein
MRRVEMAARVGRNICLRSSNPGHRWCFRGGRADSFTVGALTLVESRRCRAVSALKRECGLEKELH